MRKCLIAYLIASLSPQLLFIKETSIIDYVLFKQAVIRKGNANLTSLHPSDSHSPAPQERKKSCNFSAAKRALLLTERLFNPSKMSLLILKPFF